MFFFPRSLIAIEFACLYPFRKSDNPFFVEKPYKRRYHRDKCSKNYQFTPEGFRLIRHLIIPHGLRTKRHRKLLRKACFWTRLTRLLRFNLSSPILWVSQSGTSLSLPIDALVTLPR
jgi:hypothetical protein